MSSAICWHCLLTSRLKPSTDFFMLPTFAGSTESYWVMLAWLMCLLIPAKLVLMRCLSAAHTLLRWILAHKAGIVQDIKPCSDTPMHMHTVLPRQSCWEVAGVAVRYCGLVQTSSSLQDCYIVIQQTALPALPAQSYGAVMVHMNPGV